MRRTHYNRIAGENLERLAALSDGIFAVAMTLLVLNLHVPDAVSKSIADNEFNLVPALIRHLPSLLTYFMSFLTLGIFWFLINAAMLKLASLFVPGFQVRGFFAAFFGAILLSLVNLALRWLFMPKKEHAE